MKEEDYLEMISKLNAQQRKIFNDFVERINCEREGNNFYLYIGGEAGTGKSFLLKAMINASKKRGKRSGAELDKPVCLTLAPTGVAAYLVNGTTIESGLGLQPTKDRAYIRNQASRNSSLRFLYEDLQCIFLDEVSMCGSDMLAKMNFRMQEIMGNSNFMGGVSLVCTGDFGQLPPVGQRMIWETSYLDNRLEISPNHWDENFKIYYLTQKMRSQDEEFSNICDDVRKGTCDEKVIDYFENHVGKCPSEDDNTKYADGKLSIIVTTNDAREKINNDKLEKLLPGKKVYFANAIDKATNNPNAPEVSDKIPLTRTGQLQKRIVFKEGAPDYF
jgi:ATP-dependent DNA helicase PIF1